MIIFYATLLIGIVALAGYQHNRKETASPWNMPYSTRDNRQYIVNYTAFVSSPKTLDPARSYVEDEARIIAQIYEPPLQYHYLKIPYQLIPLTASKLPKITWLDKNHRPFSKDSKATVAFSTFDIYIKPHINYQPHAAFAKDAKGAYLYHHLQPNDWVNIHQLSDFKAQGTRELTAADYVYQIKRLAHPQLNSPIFSLMSQHIVGLTEYRQRLGRLYHDKRKQTKDPNAPIRLDLRRYPLSGAKVISRYHYQITVKNKYPQLIYWLAMPFFAPTPWEADAFYLQPGMAERNLSLNNNPIGTGPYQLTVNQPNKIMVLERNPNFHPEYYPKEGAPGDQEKGLLNLAGQRLPFIDRFVFQLDKETTPRWYKFLQGYYDESTIDSNSFDQAIQMDEQGRPQLTPELKKKQLKLRTSTGLTVFYSGFNMLDKVVGGYSERARKLRQAITIALDYSEFISIFLNGRGEQAQGLIPPAVFGYLPGKKGLNPYVFQWVKDHAERKPIAVAKQLLAEAGYPNGYDAKTGQPLRLVYDTTTSSADDKARFDWYRKQFAKLGITLQIRATQFNRLQDKIQTGQAQIFTLGWIGDYPDPENFLFLLYAPNGIVKYGGPNRVNYSNPQYDTLYEKMRVMPNGPERQKIIQHMLAILYHDNPWIWGFYMKDYTLGHRWLTIGRPSALAKNSAKYLKIDPSVRAIMQNQWNQPRLIGLWILLAGSLIIIALAVIHYRLRESRPGVKRF